MKQPETIFGWARGCVKNRARLLGTKNHKLNACKLPVESGAAKPRKNRKQKTTVSHGGPASNAGKGKEGTRARQDRTRLLGTKNHKLHAGKLPVNSGAAKPRKNRKLGKRLPACACLCLLETKNRKLRPLNGLCQDITKTPSTKVDEIYMFLA